MSKGKISDLQTILSHIRSIQTLLDKITPLAERTEYPQTNINKIFDIKAKITNLELDYRRLKYSWEFK